MSWWYFWISFKKALKVCRLHKYRPEVTLCGWQGVKVLLLTKQIQRQLQSSSIVGADHQDVQRVYNLGTDHSGKELFQILLLPVFPHLTLSPAASCLKLGWLFWMVSASNFVSLLLVPVCVWTCMSLGVSFLALLPLSFVFVKCCFELETKIKRLQKKKKSLQHKEYNKKNNYSQTTHIHVQNWREIKVLIISLKWIPESHNAHCNDLFGVCDNHTTSKLLWLCIFKKKKKKNSQYNFVTHLSPWEKVKSIKPGMNG